MFHTDFFRLMLPVLTLVSLSSSSLPAIQAQEERAQAPEVEVRELLEKGWKAGKLPEGMSIRISECLGGLTDPANHDLPDGRVESWEISAGQIRRPIPETVDPETGDVIAPETSETVPFDTTGLCKDLLEGDALELRHAGGLEEPRVLVGSDYSMGSRYIEIQWNGETVVSLAETNGPFLQGFRGNDADRFGALYKRVSEKARASFEAQATPKK